MKSLATILGLVWLVPLMVFGQGNTPARTVYNIIYDGNSWVSGSTASTGSNFPSQVELMLQKAGKTTKFYNYGVPGQTITDMQSHAPERIDSNRKDFQFLVGMELVNEWGNTTETREVVYAKYKKYFQDRKVAGFQRVIAITPIAQGYYGRKNWEADRQWFIAQMLKEFPPMGILVANVGADPRFSDCKSPKYYSSDHIHPNNAGYEAMAEIVYQTLMKAN